MYLDIIYPIIPFTNCYFKLCWRHSTLRFKKVQFPRMVPGPFPGFLAFKLSNDSSFPTGFQRFAWFAILPEVCLSQKATGTWGTSTPGPPGHQVQYQGYTRVPGVPGVHLVQSTTVCTRVAYW